MLKQIRSVVRRQSLLVRKRGLDAREKDKALAVGANPVLAQRCACKFTSALSAALKWTPLRPGESLLSPGQQGVILLGAGANVSVRWPSLGFQTRGELWRGDTLGFWEYMNPSDGAGFTDAVLVEGKGVYVASKDDLDAIRAQMGDDDRFNKLCTQLGLGSLLAGNPALSAVLNTDRIALALVGRTVTRAVGTSIYAAGKKPDGVYFTLPGSQITLTQSWAPAGDQTVTQGFGALFGLGSTAIVSVDWTESAVAAGSGNYLYFSEGALAGTLRDSGSLSGDASSQYEKAIGAAWAHTPTVLGALAKVPALAGRSWQELTPLLQAWRGILWRMSAPAPAPVGDRPGLGVVVVGEVIDYAYLPASTEQEERIFGGVIMPVGVFTAGEVFGAGSLAQGAMIQRHYRVREPSLVVYIQESRILDVLGPWPPTVSADTDHAATRRGLELAAMPRAVRQQVAPVWEDGQLSRAMVRDSVTQIIFFDPMGQAESSRLMPFLVGALISSLWTQFQEHALIVVLELSDGGATAEPVVTSLGEVRCLRVLVADNVQSIAAALSAILTRTEGKQWDYLFVVAQPALTAAAELCQLVSRVVFLNTTYGGTYTSGGAVPWPDLTRNKTPYVYTTVLPDDIKRGTGANYPPSTTRLRLVDLPQLPDSPAAAVEAGYEFMSKGTVAAVFAFRRQIDRWARAVTSRRVGVALAGGEAWGAAHYALLVALEEAGIPIDVVSGASVGALFGAYYCKGGIPELDDKVMSHFAAWRWQILNFIGVLTTAPLRARVNADLAPYVLETLELPLLPVGTNTNLASPSVIMDGKTGEGVFKSGSLSPIVPPLVRDGQVWVDGAYSDNLPVDALLLEGVRMIVSSNVMAPPTPQPPRSARFPRISEALDSFNPLLRLSASYRGAFTLAYISGGRSALQGTSSFQTTWSHTSLFSIVDVQSIAQQARAEPDLWDVVAGVRARWEALAAPRCANDAVVSPEAEPQPGGQKT